MTVLTPADVAEHSPPYNAIVKFHDKTYAFLPADIGRCHTNTKPKLFCAFIGSGAGCSELTCSEGCYVDSVEYATSKLVGDI